MNQKKMKKIRLIDADALKESVHAHDYVLKDCLNSTDKGMFTVGIMQAIDEQPTIDAVSVIRCKDCKWYEFDVSHRCGYTGLNGYIAEDDFCSKAEPKVKK
jgi:hypothetical protein